MSLRKISVTSIQMKNKDKDKIEDIKKERLKELQKQFLNKNKELTKNNKPIEKEVKNKPIKKNENDKYKNKYNALELKLKKIQEKNSNNEAKLKKLKEKNFKLNELIDENNIYIDSLENKIELKDNHIDKLNEEILSLKNELNSYNVRAIRILINDLTTMKNKIKHLLKERNGLIEKNKKLHQNNARSLENIHKLLYGEECEFTRLDLRKINEKIEQERKEKQKALEYADRIQKEYKIKYSKILDENVKIRNEIFKCKNLYINKTFNARYSYIGIIEIKNNIIFFKSMAGNIYLANIDEVMNEIEDGVVCRAIRKASYGNVVKIKEIFEDTDIEIVNKKYTNYKKNKKEENIRRELNEIDYENKYNILVVGSTKFKNSYKKSIEMMNLKCDWFDTYENTNVVRLKAIEERYDIIICCRGHVRHYATDFIKYMLKNHPNKSYKYNIIDNDSVKSITTRVRYCIENFK